MRTTCLRTTALRSRENGYFSARLRRGINFAVVTHCDIAKKKTITTFRSNLVCRKLATVQTRNGQCLDSGLFGFASASGGPDEFEINIWATNGRNRKYIGTTTNDSSL